jgi:excinuclease UvrABC ATPase subunit
VHGARENNLKDVSVEIPKRRLTVFTGVSGSGKSSLVFGTIAAESQRLINETYSAFVQGFMPTLARPDVDVLDGLTTAIIVDQERMGANARSTVGTATDANAMLRILFSRLGQPHIGSPNAYSFNVPRSAAAVDHRRAGPARRRPRRRPSPSLGGMCPRCEGMGSVSDFDLTAALRRQQVAQRGRDHRPRLQHGRLVRPHLPRLRLLRPGQADPQVHQEGAARPPLREPTKIKVEGINLTYEGLIPKIQKSMLSKDVDAMQPHIRAFVERAVTFTTCPDCGGTRLAEAARSSKIAGSTSPTPARCRSATWPTGCAASTSRRSRRCSPALQHTARLVRRDRARLPLARPARRARCRAARRSAPR